MGVPTNPNSEESCGAENHWRPNNFHTSDLVVHKDTGYKFVVRRGLQHRLPHMETLRLTCITTISEEHCVNKT